MNKYIDGSIKIIDKETRRVSWIPIFKSWDYMLFRLSGQKKMKLVFFAILFTFVVTTVNAQHFVNLKEVSGAVGNGVVDDEPVLQKAIDSLISIGQTNFYFEAANYGLGKGLIYGKKNGSFTLSIHIIGDGTSYDNIAGQTIFTALNGNSFGFGFQRCKGAIVEGVLLLGYNTVVNNYTVPQVMADTTKTFVGPGVRDDRYSPHAGIVIDPFGDQTIAISDRYPGFEDWYINTGNGGSTDIRIKDCRARYFVVDYLFSPHSIPQNGEIIHVEDCWGDNAKSAVAVGEAQARSIYLENFHSWGNTQTIFDCVNYGGGAGCPPKVIGLNAAGSARNLCLLNTWVSEGLNISRSHIESLWSLGGCSDPTGGNLTLEDSWVSLVGSLPYTFYGQPIVQPKTSFQGGYLKVINCNLWEYGSIYALPLVLNCPNAIFDRTTFNYIPVDNYSLSFPNFTNCFTTQPFGDSKIIGTAGATSAMQGVTPPFIGAMSYLSRNGRIRRRVDNPNSGVGGLSSVSFNSTLTITSIDTMNLIATATILSSVDYKNIIKGDIIMYRDTDEYNKPQFVSLGVVTKKVDSINSITLGGRGRGLKVGFAYNAQIYRSEELIGVLILGSTITGSNVITNVQVEANGSFNIVGVPLYMPQFPNGTTITGFGTGTITVSQPATFTDSNAVVMSANWKGEEQGTINAPTKQGYKKGDIIWNNRPDQFPNVTYWICTKSGIMGTSNQPTFFNY